MKNMKKKLEILEKGVLEIRCQQITSFSEINCPNIVNYLDLSNNNITDFSSFWPSYQLKTLILDGNPILSFQNFPQQHNIENISLLFTPISKHPNFRLLALFALGINLKVINGEDVTPEELKLLSNNSLKSFFRSSDENSLLNRFSSLIRNGYIGEIFPKSLEKAEKDNINQQYFPLSMKIMRLFRITKMDEIEKQNLFEQIFSNKKVKTVKVKTPKIVNEQLKKQNVLIEYLQNELEQLKQVNKERDEQKQKKTSISEENEEKYNEILYEYGFLLNENDIKIEEFNEEKEKLRNIAKISLGRKDENLSDREIATFLTQKFLK